MPGWPVILLLAGVVVYAGLVLAALAFGFRPAWPFSVIWIIAAGLPAAGLAGLFFRARAEADFSAIERRDDIHE
jgi:pheromone shutdown protein TraB